MKKEISKKSVLGCLRFVSIIFLIFEKGDKWKNVARFFKICKYTFLIFENVDKWKKWVRICKYSFLIFGKRGKRKNCVRFFKVCKYTFSNFCKRGSGKKICQDSQIYFFWYFKNKISGKTVLGFLRFGCLLF